MEPLKTRVLFEDNHLLIVNKQPGEIVQGDKTGDEPLVETLKSYIKEKYNKPGAVFLGLVHRLDRPVSGAVIFARTSKALGRMNEMFKTREVRKVYWAIVGGRQSAVGGQRSAVNSQQEWITLQHYLKRNEQQNKSYPYDTPGEGRQMAERYFTLDVMAGNHAAYLRKLCSRERT